MNGAFDPREKISTRFDAWYGEPDLKQDTVFVNAGESLGGGTKVYAWASYQNVMQFLPVTSDVLCKIKISSRFTPMAFCHKSRRAWMITARLWHLVARW